MPDPAELEAHPAAALFPHISGAGFQALVEDIRARGLRVPILVDGDGRVLDGRARLGACLIAGVEPLFDTWYGPGSPLEVVVSLNLLRRHLNESQRAIIGAQIKERWSKGPAANWPIVQATEKAALLMSISPRSVRRAARVLRAGDPELIRLVQSGELAVSAALDKLEERPLSCAAGGPVRFPILHVQPRWNRQKVETLAALPLGDLAAADAVLFLRAPDHMLAGAIRLIERWGFHYEASIVVRRRARARRYTWSQHDLVLIASRGRPPAPLQTLGSVSGGRGRPDLTEIIERMFPRLPRADALAASARRPPARA